MLSKHIYIVTADKEFVFTKKNAIKKGSIKTDECDMKIIYIQH